MQRLSSIKKGNITPDSSKSMKIEVVGAALSKEEIMSAEVRLKEMQPLGNKKVLELFPHIRIWFKLCKKKARKQRDEKNIFKKMLTTVSKQINFYDKDKGPLLQQIEQQDKHLDKLLTQYDDSYKGTEPVNDYNIIYSKEQN